MTCVNPSSWAKDCPAYGVQQTRNAITKAQTLTIKHNVTIFLLIKAKVHNLKFENFKKKLWIFNVRREKTAYIPAGRF